jgi:monoamine oxidase
MSRSSSLERLSRIVRAAEAAERTGMDSSEVLDRLRLAERQLPSRREFLRSVGAAAALGAAGTLLPAPLLAGKPGGAQRDVAIVGGGLAGLACADELIRLRMPASAIYEAAPRLGGRCWSLRGLFPGQVAERGGELIDNLHKTMLGYARRFGLRTEDMSNVAGEVFYHFDGQLHPEAAVVEQYRQFVPAMRGDLRRLSKEITADSYSAFDAQLDGVSLLAYLEGQNSLGTAAGPLVKKVIIEAYEAEYGLDAAEQSCLNFLLFIHADRRSKFTPFGVFSDERYHLVDGNDAVVQGLAAAVGPIDLGMRLVRVARTAGGRVELTFDQGGSTVVRTHDAAVIAIPFSVLRDVELHASLALPAAKSVAIQQLGYGTNAKMMIGFEGRPWRDFGGSGASYADLPNHQAAWETNPARATGSRGVLTDYSSAARGAGMNPADIQGEAAAFLGDLDLLYPGASTRASIDGGLYVVHLEHWPSSPFVRGSYTCYRPGQFTTIAGNEGKPWGNLFFAGEHANSFYEWQGFMEGAALSGIDAAAQVAKAVKVGQI